MGTSTIGGAGAGQQSNTPGFDRFRSFTERYLIERAGSFRPGAELEDAWRAVQDAKRIYGMIADARTNLDEPGAQRGEGAAAPSPNSLMKGQTNGTP